MATWPASRRGSTTSSDLGVNAIYLNPIFATRSNHGYDTIDYEHVAPHFGGDAALADLRRATADRDIRLILDIAPNHAGAEHPWFLAAQADPAAETAGYFIFRERPDDYESWLGVTARCPSSTTAAPTCARRCTPARTRSCAAGCEPPYSVDGWRIDVANMLGRLGPDQLGAEVARGMRQAVKEEDPDAYLIGEHSYDATEQLAGDQWDGVMNYAGFRSPVLDWLGGIELLGSGGAAVPAGRPVVDGRHGRDARRLPGRDPVGGRPLPVQPARQPRHGARPHGRRRRRGTGRGRPSGCC